MAGKKANKEIPPIVVRRSVASFIMRIIFLELLFEFIYLVWRGLLHLLPLSLEVTLTMNIVSLILFFVFITLIQNIFLIMIALNWINDYYEIRVGEIAHLHGIFSKTEKAYPYRDIQSITVHQGLLGRVFNYGSVDLYIPTLGHDLSFREVSNPSLFVELVKSANPEIASGRYIFPR